MTIQPPAGARVLFTKDRIGRRVRALAATISRDYAGKKLTVVCILQGSVIFFADLLRNLAVDCDVDFIAVASYRGTRSSGRVRLLKGLREQPSGKHLLLVEDIVDTGTTLAFVRQNLERRKAASVRVCALLDKPAARRTAVTIDYRGFTVANAFVVGYGLDYNQKYRGLPYIALMNTRPRR